MSASPPCPQTDSPVILFGDYDTVRHRDVLAREARQRSHVVIDVVAFAPGVVASTDDLSRIEAVVTALGRAFTARADLWAPFPWPDLVQEQHSRRLSLVLQRHGGNLLVGRDLVPAPIDLGVNWMDFALRREVHAVNDLDNAVLAAFGAESLGREIELALASVPARVPEAPSAVGRVSGAVGVTTDSRSGGDAPPVLPLPTAPWGHRLPELRRYAWWLVCGCGVPEEAMARVLNSSGQRMAEGQLWTGATVAELLSGRYG